MQGLWYSEEPIFAEEDVRMYVALRNNAESDLTGKVRFIDNGTVVATKNISAISGRLVEAWADWNPSFGEHRLEVVLSDVYLQAVGEGAEFATVTHAIAEDILFVDFDTDKDGIGNKEDTDDDGDDISDIDEVAQGTDPLVFDEPEEDEETESQNENDTNENNDTSESGTNEDGDGNDNTSSGEGGT